VTYGLGVAVIVRPARPEDWRELRDVRLRALADAPDAFGEVLGDAQRFDDAAWESRTSRRPGVLVLVAERERSPIGMMVVVVKPDDGRRANVYAMWVAPEARGSGVGRKLVDAGLAWARRQGALDVELHVSERHPDAKRLYMRCGFAPTGELSPIRPGSELQAETLTIRLAPLIMGIVNVTPDSFSDGGQFLDSRAAIEHGWRLAEEGADILDVGGEATNPKATPISAAEELRRVLPVIEGLSKGGYLVSVDTTKAEVAYSAVNSGALIVNDVSGGLFDAAMAETVAELAQSDDVTYIAGHLRGRTLAEVFAPEGHDGPRATWRDVADELADRIRPLPDRVRVWGDPGIGFGKGSDPEGNASLLRHAGDIAETLRRPVVVGPSRKRFLRRLLGVQDAGMDVLDAASVLAALAGLRAGAHCVRAHNVALLRTHLTAYNKK
jgi:dihydropteroate synthase